MTSPRIPLHLEGRLAYAELCLDRFVEVYKARLALWTFFSLAMVTLAGFGVQFQKPPIILIAAIVPFGTLLIDIFVKRNYAAPFLYIAMKIEYELLGKESAVLLFAGSNVAKRKIYELTLRREDEEIRQSEFRSAYVSSGMARKLGACLVASITMILISLLLF